MSIVKSWNVDWELNRPSVRGCAFVSSVSFPFFASSVLSPRRDVSVFCAFSRGCLVQLRLVVSPGSVVHLLCVCVFYVCSYVSSVVLGLRNDTVRVAKNHRK